MHPALECCYNFHHFPLPFSLSVVKIFLFLLIFGKVYFILNYPLIFSNKTTKKQFNFSFFNKIYPLQLFRKKNNLTYNIQCFKSQTTIVYIPYITYNAVLLNMEYNNVGAPGIWSWSGGMFAFNIPDLDNDESFQSSDMIQTLGCKHREQERNPSKVKCDK